VIHAEVDNTRIRYWHICVGGKKYFHQLVLWSLPSKFDANKAAFDRIIKAYREHSAELDTPTRGE
jgi:hypothetical protein